MDNDDNNNKLFNLIMFFMSNWPDVITYLLCSLAEAFKQY